MMKRRSTLVLFLLAFMMLSTLASCQSNAASSSGSTSNIKIGIIKWVTHDALDSTEQGFVDALAANGYIDNGNISIDYQNANDNTSIAATIGDRFVNNKVDLILAIATPAVQSVQSKTTTIPILGTAVTDFVGAHFAETNERPGGNITGASDLTPVADQLALLKQILPEATTIGIIYNSSEENSRIQSEMAVESAEALGLTVTIKTVSSVNDIPQTAESLAKEVDAFWIPTDNMLASAMDVLSTKALENKIPVVCGEDNMVKNGGTFTIGIDYYKLGYQTGEMAVRILKDGANPAEMPIEYQHQMDIVINSANAAAIGLVFPQDILDQATDAAAR